MILAHGHTSVCCLILHLFFGIWYSVVEHTLYHVSLYIVLLPILGIVVVVVVVIVIIIIIIII